MVSILKAHEFPPTTLRFNPTSTLLVSGSVDNCLRIIAVPDSTGDQCELTYHKLDNSSLQHLFAAIGALTSVIVIVLAIILAIVVQQLLASEVLVEIAD